MPGKVRTASECKRKIFSDIQESEGFESCAQKSHKEVLAKGRHQPAVPETAAGGMVTSGGNKGKKSENNLLEIGA